MGLRGRMDRREVGEVGWVEEIGWAGEVGWIRERSDGIGWV
jgi:hypothetical protein